MKYDLQKIQQIVNDIGLSWTAKFEALQKMGVSEETSKRLLAGVIIRGYEKMGREMTSGVVAPE